MSAFRVRILGSMEILRNGVPVKTPTGRQRTLLVVLALSGNRPVSVEEIIERLWGDDFPDGATTTVRSQVKRLRRQLDTTSDESAVRTENGGYRLDTSLYELDYHRFRSVLDRAAAAPDRDTEERLLCEALELWRGPALCDVFSESLHRELVPAIQERYRQALYRRIELQMGRGRQAEVVPELRQLVGADPLQERFWAQLIRALDSTGRTAEAMDCYEQCRRELIGRLGVDPGSELRGLHQSLLTSTGRPVAARPFESATPQQAGGHRTTPAASRGVPHGRRRSGVTPSSAPRRLEYP